MPQSLLSLFAVTRSFLAALKEEGGQDLIEYALVVALIAFAAVGTMSTLANNINAAFSNISSQVASNT